VIEIVISSHILRLGWAAGEHISI